MVVIEVIAGIVLLVGVLLAFDWLMAGRAKGRLLVRVKDQSENAGSGYAVIERDLKSMDRNGHQFP